MATKPTGKHGDGNNRNLCRPTVEKLFQKKVPKFGGLQRRSKFLRYFVPICITWSSPSGNAVSRLRPRRKYVPMLWCPWEASFVPWHIMVVNVVAIIMITVPTPHRVTPHHTSARASWRTWSVSSWVHTPRPTQYFVNRRMGLRFCSQKSISPLERYLGRATPGYQTK